MFSLRQAKATIAATVLVSCHLGSCLAAQKTTGSSSAMAHSIYQMNAPMFGEMPLIAPLFLQNDQVDTTLTVVNPIVYATQGTITLRGQSGDVIGAKVVNFPAHSSTALVLKDLLVEFRSLAHSGSVSIDQDPAVKGPALAAQLSMSLHMGSQAAFLEEEFGMPSAHDSGILQGVASQTANKPLIAITSSSDVPQKITMSCLGSENFSKTLDLAARATAVVKACSWQKVPDGSLNQPSMFSTEEESTPTDYAVTLRSDGVAGSFYAYGLSMNMGLKLAQLQPLDFYDPGHAFSSEVAFVGIPTGPTALFSEVASNPVMTIANFSDKARVARIMWSDSSTGSPKVQEVTSLLLAPRTLKTTSLSMVRGSGLLNTFTVASDGKPGDIQSHLYTRLGNTMQRTELLAKDMHDDHNGGDHPWSLAGGDKSTLILSTPIRRSTLST